MASFTWEVETAPFPNAGTQVILMPAFKDNKGGYWTLEAVDLYQRKRHNGKLHLEILRETAQKKTPKVYRS